MQKDLDDYLIRYNTKRPHQGRSIKGKTPAEVFLRCLPKPVKPKNENKLKRLLELNRPGVATVRCIAYLYMRQSTSVNRTAISNDQQNP